MNALHTPATGSPLFDSHCHCGLSVNGTAAPQPGAFELIASAAMCHWEAVAALLAPDRQRWGALGLHPWHADQWSEEAERRLTLLLENPHIVAIGEVGFDAPAAAAALQQEFVLRAQIRLAVAAEKPLVLHVHRGYARVLDILRQEGAEKVGGVVHGFNAGANIGMEFVRLGFYLGIGPSLLKQKARKLPQALEALSLNNLVLETDAQDGREGCFSPKERQALLRAIVQRLANIKHEDHSSIGAQLWSNSRRLFSLPALS